MPKQHKRSIEATVEIDGFELHWELRRELQWSAGDGYKGMAISVRLIDGKHRELILEYPAPPKKTVWQVRLLERPNIVPNAVEENIRQAMAAGWNPASRGRPFMFQVPGKSD
jgi:hypothetical protein